jgi:hypothetical protein
VAADGALLWEQRYNGPAKEDDFVGGARSYFGGAHSLSVGPNGMVAVTGSSSDDFATVVYREVLPPISIELVPAGIRLRFTGMESGAGGFGRSFAASPEQPGGGTRTADFIFPASRDRPGHGGIGDKPL